MTYEDPLVDILTRRIIELEQEVERLKREQVTVTFSHNETQPLTPSQYQNHKRCADYVENVCVPYPPCPDCDLNFLGENFVTETV